MPLFAEVTWQVKPYKTQKDQQENYCWSFWV